MGIFRVLSNTPYSLPLTRDEFAAALRKGHGRALQQVARCGALGFDDLIVNACLHDKRFDPQCESDRTSWMIEIMDAADLGAVVCRKLVESLSAGVESFWDTNRLCGFAAVLARRGQGAARSALYGAFRKNDDSADLIAAEEIIELDGADGLLFVSERIGQWMLADAEVVVGDAPLLWYNERNGEGAAERVLASAAMNNDRIAEYLSRVRAGRGRSFDSADRGRRDRYIKPDILRFGRRRESRANKMYAMSPDEVIRFIEAGAPGFGKYALSGWGRRASEDALRQVADRMFRETNPNRLARFLGIFQSRPLPEFDSRLLRFTDHTDHDVRWVTMFVLAHHQHPDVRALALDRVRAGRHTEHELSLFRKNFEPGDWSLIRKYLRWPADENYVHRIVGDLLGVFEPSRGDESREPLLLVYEHSPCTNCRSQAVTALLDAKQAPGWLLEECRDDTDQRIRDAVAEETS
jgi:hypothetical protein